MATDIEIAWFAGLFEGEGTFTFDHGVPKSISIQMTDLDILQKVQNLFGGSLYIVSKRKDHWKDCWMWRLSKNQSVAVVEACMPYLGARRSARGSEYLAKIREISLNLDESNLIRVNRNDEIRQKYSTGEFTHKELSTLYDLDRTMVTKIINGQR